MRNGRYHHEKYSYFIFILPDRRFVARVETRLLLRKQGMPDVDSVSVRDEPVGVSFHGMDTVMERVRLLDILGQTASVRCV
jgi:hypothetical protein